MFHRLVNNRLFRWRHLLPRLLDRQAILESGIIMITALVVGGGAGPGAVFFRWLIKAVQTLAFEGLSGHMAWMQPCRTSTDGNFMDPLTK